MIASGRDGEVDQLMWPDDTVFRCTRTGSYSFRRYYAASGNVPVRIVSAGASYGKDFVRIVSAVQFCGNVCHVGVSVRCSTGNDFSRKLPQRQPPVMTFSVSFRCTVLR